MSVVAACDLRAKFGAARDQGSRPSCLAFALSDAHSVERGPFAELSAEHLFYHAVQRTPGKNPNQGTYFDIGLEALRLDGQALEAGWAYSLSLPATWLPPSTATPAYKRDSISQAIPISDIVAHLNNGKPVVLSLHISTAFCSAIGGLVLQQANDADVAWHGVVAVGHGHDGPKHFFLIRNSWGAGWGINGYAWVESDYVATRLGDFATLKV